MTLSRRQFLTKGTLAAVGASALAATPSWSAQSIPRTSWARRTAPNQWLPELPPGEHLRALAAAAMDAAKAAGADDADIRIGVQRRVSVYGYPHAPEVGWSAGYGIRAWHGGTWSFQHGNLLTTDAVVATARNAVDGARVYAGVNAQLKTHQRSAPRFGLAADTPWAPTPVVTGEWRVPVEIDPFIVPIDDYYRAIDALRDVTVPDRVWRNVSAFAYLLGWQTESRVFASTAGSLVTQHTMCGGLGLQGSAELAGESDNIFLHLPGLDRVCAGFEVVLRPDVPEYIQRLYDDLLRWRELPYRPFRDVGRFPFVLDGRTMAGVVGATVDMALDGDRVSGLESDASGGSFLAPPDAILQAQTPQFSPLLHVRAHRTLPSPMAVQWDDDGVVPEPYAVIDAGRVVDFHTTRETAPMLAAWAQAHGRPVRSHGCAVAPTPESVPRGTGGHLVVAPAASAASIADLMRGMSHGFVLINGAVGTTPGLTAGTIEPRVDGLAIEVRCGVPVARTEVHAQFNTKLLLGKNIRALGDATTVGTEEIDAEKGIPWQATSQLVTAPAALCVDVDVLP